MKNEMPNINRPKSQTEVDQNILSFLGDLKITSPQDLIVLKDKILNGLESRPYDSETKAHADSIQWKRTASEVISDGFIYEGKACSDLAVVFLTLCKALNIDGRLVKLVTTDSTNTHSIVEVNLNNTWYRIDPSAKDAVPFEGALTDEDTWNKKFKVWKKGRDVWDLDLESIDDEEIIEKPN